MEEITKIANSWPIWVAAGALVSIVIIQSLLFIRHAYKNAPLVGVSKSECKEAVRIGMVTSIGPTIAIFIVVVSMMIVVGSPITWMRLSMIGNASTELTASTLGAQAYGVTLGGEGYNLEAMATAWWAMSFNGAGWLIICAFLTPHLEKVRLKVGGGDARWISLMTAAAMMGLYAYMSAPYLIGMSGQCFVSIVGFAVMFVLIQLSNKYKWLKEWNLGIAILVGTVAGIIFA
jgi:hypothetical protein